MTDAFSELHPIVNFVFFCFVLVFSMVFVNPVCVFISVFCAFIYSYLQSKKNGSLKFILPMLLFTAVLNPLLNHQGMTIITYLWNGNPLTLESLLYGVSSAFILLAVLSWFNCFNRVMKSDKILFLFGRILPSLSLILTMVFRFYNRFTIQLKIITNAQKCFSVESKSLFSKAKNGMKILLVMVSWIFENALETSDSMKSRGYELGNKTNFSIFSFEKRDYYSLLFIILSGVYIAAGAIGNNGISFSYFPKFKGNLFSIYSISVYIVYLLLCLFPVFVSIIFGKKSSLIRDRKEYSKLIKR